MAGLQTHNSLKEFIAVVATAQACACKVFFQDAKPSRGIEPVHNGDIAQVHECWSKSWLLGCDDHTAGQVALLANDGDQLISELFCLTRFCQKLRLVSKMVYVSEESCGPCAPRPEQ